MIFTHTFLEHFLLFILLFYVKQNSTSKKNLNRVLEFQIFPSKYKALFLTFLSIYFLEIQLRKKKSKKKFKPGFGVPGFASNIVKW